MDNTKQYQNVLSVRMIIFCEYVNNAIWKILKSGVFSKALSDQKKSSQGHMISDICHHFDEFGSALCAQNAPMCVDAMEYMSYGINRLSKDKEHWLSEHIFPLEYGAVHVEDYTTFCQGGVLHTGEYEKTLALLLQGPGGLFMEIRYNTIFNPYKLEDKRVTRRALEVLKLLSYVLSAGITFVRGNTEITDAACKRIPLDIDNLISKRKEQHHRNLYTKHGLVGMNRVLSDMEPVDDKE